MLGTGLLDGGLNCEALVAEHGAVDILDGLLDGGVVSEADQGVVHAVGAEGGDLAAVLEEGTDLVAGGHLTEDGTNEDGDGGGLLVSGRSGLSGGDGDGAAVDLLLVEGSDGLGGGGVVGEPDEGVLEAAEADLSDVTGGLEDVLDVSDGFATETLDVDTVSGSLGGGSLGGSSSLGSGGLSGSLSGGLGGGLSSGFGVGLRGHDFFFEESFFRKFSF